MNNLKNIIRKKVLTFRESLSPEEVHKKSNDIFEKLINTPMYINSNNIFTYMNFRNEVKTNIIIDHALLNNKNIYIPLCNDSIKGLVLCKMNDWNYLKPNKMGILEPVKETIEIANRKLIDMAIVPGAVFDRCGNRIGYGAGYYDRFFFSLKNDICKIALCYSFQVVESISPSSHDVPMDYIITENEIIECKKVA